MNTIKHIPTVRMNTIKHTPTVRMNYRTRQILEKTVQRFTAFPSFSDLVCCAMAHGYTPTIIGWRGHCLRDRIRIRHLAQAFDTRMEELGSARRAYRGCDA